MRAEQKQPSAQKQGEVTESGGDAAEGREKERDKEPNRSKVWANMEEGGGGNQQPWQ